MLLNNRNVYNKKSFEIGLTAFELSSINQIEDWKNEFSIVDYYGIIWSGSKKFIHIINGKEYILPKNSFLFIAPNLIQDFVKQPSRSDAYYIVFKQEFYSKSIEDNLKLENSTLFSRDLINIVENSICSAPIFENNYIKYFFTSFENELDIKLAHNLLERIIINGQMETFDIQSQFIQDDFDVELATKFKKLLQDNVNEEKQVSFYIDKLFITKRRLNKATQIVFGKTAKEMIVEELMKNAKILLVNSKMSIKDIALELNFLQETNFTAFFKKNAGISPTKFRQSAPN
ncbi:AraC family transcriptional regulator [Empedobacter tilapiae]|uniref:Helix-turn-helix domain-containing protein n=1 Tax=Empedobacter tilapiae TaxID=2491114 RepID=A0A4Z1CAQ0_9FLAO|nr:helix-turn-helix domain-containing protein [Empedobacter tilapiae]TGN29351.1 helix-turn-helix domain-containing protein [Empedobacter tilapiae]